MYIIDYPLHEFEILTSSGDFFVAVSAEIGICKDLQALFFSGSKMRL